MFDTDRRVGAENWCCERRALPAQSVTARHGEKAGRLARKRWWERLGNAYLEFGVQWRRRSASKFRFHSSAGRRSFVYRKRT